MATDKPRMRKSATSLPRKTVKSSLVVSVELHSRWSVAASLAGMDRNAFAVKVLAEALQGLVIIDRRKSGGRVVSDSEVDRAEPA